MQAQYPSNSFSAPIGFYEDLLQLKNQEDENQSKNLLNYSYQQIWKGALLSDPESELTRIVSASRKRNRTDEMHLAQFQFVTRNAAAAAISNSKEIRFNDCSGASTSGRYDTVPLSPLDLQNREIDSLIKLQNEKLRLGLEEIKKRHYRSLLPILEQQILKSLREKETELKNASRRNAELEEKVNQLSAVKQIWCEVARSSEASVSNLRASLEQILLQTAWTAKEGYGDSSEGGCDETGDMERKTVWENRDLKRRGACKACRENDVSVLLLPCRHLCLCKECESRMDSCPICKSTKNSSVKVFMS